MKKKVLKNLCIAPPPLLLSYTDKLQGLFALVAIALFVIFIVFFVKKVLRKEKNIFSFFMKLSYIEIGLLIFAFYPAYHYSKYIIIYPVIIAYLLFGYLFLAKLKIFLRNRITIIILVIMLLLATTLAYIKVELIGISKSTETNSLTDSIERQGIVKGGCDQIKIW